MTDDAKGRTQEVTFDDLEKLIRERALPRDLDKLIEKADDLMAELRKRAAVRGITAAALIAKIPAHTRFVWSHDDDDDDDEGARYQLEAHLDNGADVWGVLGVTSAGDLLVAPLADREWIDPATDRAVVDGEHIDVPATYRRDWTVRRGIVERTSG